ncbi:annexin B10-like [Condylostylus longicornis]|uniref:annexin B10-like n=1 Tax=Condylostylus longicornis TaxID=2530218 RepID=UPI00244DAB61|nr:annexin B10-like [Condylostylus longicornis]
MSCEQRPCVFPAENFDASEDAATLRAAMKGFGTDEKAIIELITSRSNAQRQQIKEAFEKELERDLIEDLKSELGGNFERVILALMSPPIEYLCKELHRSMEGMGTNENAIIEILCSRPSEEINEIVSTYESLYDRPLVEHLCREISGKFSRLITLIVTGTRDPVGTVDPDQANDDAQALYAAGEAKLGTDEHVFNRIMAHSSFAQLSLVFDEYKTLSGMTIEQAIKHEFSGNLHDALIAIVECTQSLPAYFAKQLFKAMDGMGTDDSTLIRIIVSRSEIDLESIKDEFERMYNRTLSSAVKSETSGDYKKALLGLLGA